jgi:hypothetical protein
MIQNHLKNSDSKTKNKDVVIKPDPESPAPNYREAKINLFSLKSFLLLCISKCFNKLFTTGIFNKNQDLINLLYILWISIY